MNRGVECHPQTVEGHHLVMETHEIIISAHMRPAKKKKRALQAGSEHCMHGACLSGCRQSRCLYQTIKTAVTAPPLRYSEWRLK